MHVLKFYKTTSHERKNTKVAFTLRACYTGDIERLGSLHRLPQRLIQIEISSSCRPAL
jgi:hypothetical protein